MGVIQFDEQASDPSTPSTGEWVLYSKAGGIFHMDDLGVVTQLNDKVLIQQDKVVDYGVLASDMGSVLTNSGDTDAIIFTLPDGLTVVGQSITFVKVADFNLTITSTNGDVIADSAVNGTIANTTPGETNMSITLTSIDAGADAAWLVTGAQGTWVTT